VIRLRTSVVALGIALLNPTMSYAFCANPSADSRLQVYCMSNLLAWTATDVGSAQALDYRLKQEGYDRGIGLPGIVKQKTFSPYIAPILEYSSDINGGNPNRPLVLGSLTFVGDEEFFRKKGILAGIGLGGNGRVIYGEGKYLDYSVGGSYTHSPKHDIGITRGFTNFCSKNDIGGNFYLDGCLAANQLDRELSDETTGSATVSVAKIFSEGRNRFHQASIGLRRYFEDEYEQNQLSLRLETLHSSELFSSVIISLGEAVEDTLALRNSFSATVGTSFMNKPISASFSYSYSDGGRLFGFSREETTKIITLSYTVHPRINVLIGYRDTNSNIDYFSENEAIFGFQFAPIRF